jgi:hypothetical protein
MARKKSVKLAAKRFRGNVQEITNFFQQTSGLPATHHIWCTEYAIIRLYREFEIMMLSTLVGAINNDNATLSQTLGFNFPKHMSEDVCTYLIIGTGYFDFKGRDGLIQIVKSFVPDTHYLSNILKSPQYKDSLEKLSALRNFATHDSNKAKKSATKATQSERFGSVGTWLKREERFEILCDNLTKLAHDIEKNPHIRHLCKEVGATRG